MEMIIVFFIIGFAAIYVGRDLYKQFTGKKGCSGGCSSCSSGHKERCSDLPQTFKFDKTDPAHGRIN